MYCEKHGSKMTLLLTSYVCDECDSPRQVQNKPSAVKQQTVTGELFPLSASANRNSAELVMENYTGLPGMELRDPTGLRYSTTFSYASTTRKVALFYCDDVGWPGLVWKDARGWDSFPPASALVAVTWDLRTAIGAGAEWPGGKTTRANSRIAVFTYP